MTGLPTYLAVWAIAFSFLMVFSSTASNLHNTPPTLSLLALPLPSLHSNSLPFLPPLKSY